MIHESHKALCRIHQFEAQWKREINKIWDEATFLGSGMEVLLDSGRGRT